MRIALEKSQVMLDTQQDKAVKSKLMKRSDILAIIRKDAEKPESCDNTDKSKLKIKFAMNKKKVDSDIEAFVPRKLSFHASRGQQMHNQDESTIAE